MNKCELQLHVLFADSKQVDDHSQPAGEINQANVDAIEQAVKMAEESLKDDDDELTGSLKIMDETDDLHHISLFFGKVKKKEARGFAGMIKSALTGVIPVIPSVEEAALDIGNNSDTAEPGTED